MSKEPRLRGRPKGVPKFTIQKHVFLDAATAEMLKQLANGNESAYIRELIRKQFENHKGDTI